jgi:hypothetical protein
MHAMVLVYSGLQGLVDMAEVRFIQGSNFHTVWNYSGFGLDIGSVYWRFGINGLDLLKEFVLHEILI